MYAYVNILVFFVLCEYVRIPVKNESTEVQTLGTMDWYMYVCAMQSFTLYLHIDINTCTSLEKAHMLIESLPIVCNGEKMAKWGDRD